jgi:hypothetical protein
MKLLRLITIITTGFVPVFSTLAQDSVAVEGKVVQTGTKEPIGAFTVKAYPAQSAFRKDTLALTSNKPLAQTLTRADGTYSLPISTKLKTVLLSFEKLSYFSVPPEQTVQLIVPKTAVPDVVAVKYTDAQTVSTRDLRNALSIREASFKAINGNMPATERVNALKRLIELDLISLQKSGVDPVTIAAMKGER